MKNLLAVCLILASSSCMAQVYKCAGNAGKTVYSDTPCSLTAERINAASSSGGFSAPRKVSSADQPMDLSNAPLECKFKAYKFGDDKGKLLADKAKAECMRNIELKKEGRGQEASTEAYGFWRDHSQMMATKRSSSRTLNCTPSGFGNMRCN